VSELCDAYLELHSRPRKRSAADDEQRVRDFLKPAWGSRKAVDIVRPDVIALHRRVGSERGQYTANRLLATISSMWNWAEREGLLPLGHPNPARGVSRFPEQSRDRWLTPAEVRRVFDAVKQEANPHVRAFFALALLTGARKRELLTLRWDAVQDGLLRIGQTKNGQPHVLPLSDPAQAILAALPRTDGNPFVFPSPLRRGEALSVPVVDQAWRKIRTSAELGDARVHDLRRTLGSWLAQSGASLPMIGRALNHRSQAATAVYARLALDGVRQVLDGHAQALRRVGLDSVEVVPGRNRKLQPSRSHLRAAVP
jgi:integrase